MNFPVDVIATFNTVGKIKPNYIRLEDDEHSLHTYKIEWVEYTKEEKYAGIRMISFLCSINVDGCKKNIKLSYIIDTNKWLLIH